MTQLKKLKCLDALDLKILAIVLMLCDHMWATVVPGAQWMWNIGRIAFPIFAFQIAEGYFQTHNYKKYLGRLFLFALISEIPFNLMYEGSLFFPFHQNVLFTFCLALLLMKLLDKCREKNVWLYAVMLPVVFLLANVVGLVTFVDFYGFGIMMVLLFYATRGLPLGWLIQAVGMWIINVEMMGGLTIPMDLFGMHFDVTQQGFALLALIPIWLYNGKQGPHSRKLQYFFYAFYPAHILILAVLALYVL